MCYLVDELFSEAEVVVVVQDSLNPHTPAALYEAFEPAEAKRILDRLVFYGMPQHGRWLNMVGIELSIPSKRCLDDRMPDDEALQRKVEAWQSNRNEQRATVNWLFGTSDARVKIERLYPNLPESS